MKYVFQPKYRLSYIRGWRLFGSRWVLLLFLALSVVAGVAWFAVMTAQPAPSAQLVGVVLLSSALAVGCLLLFTFGLTYFPSISPSKTAERGTLAGHSGVINVASLATFDLIHHLGTQAKRATPAALAASLDALWEDPAVRHVVERLQLHGEDVLNVIRTTVLPALDWPQFAQGMFEVAVALDQLYVAPEHAFGYLLTHPNIHDYLRAQDITEEDVSFVIWWETQRRLDRQIKQRWWDVERLLSFSGVGLSWASGYTPFVDQFVTIPQGNLWDIPHGHMPQVEQVTSALARQRQSNVLIVGQPGVGRLGVVKEIARRIAAGRAHPALSGLRVLYIHVGQLLGLAATAAGQVATVSRALREMERAGNVVAVLDGLSSILGQESESRVNVTEMLVPFLASATVRTVVIMSSDEYHLRVKSNQELLQYFEVVHVPPLSDEVTLQLLALTSPAWEAATKVYLPYKALRAIVRGTSTVMPQLPFPERAFDVLEEVLVAAQGKGEDVVSEELVNTIISGKVGIDIGRLRAGEREHLLQLEDIIHRRVVNQERGVAAVARAMIRARAGVRTKKRPIGTFLFLGPTGVGKTETSKALAEAYFGSEGYLERLDMSEFAEEDGVSRLIGDLTYPTGRLTSLIADHPFTVLLLDEFEKAHRNVQQVFLPVFDEGRLTDVRGRQYSFQHAIIIATSNAGAEYIRQHVSPAGTMPDGFDRQLREHVLRQDIFRPELLNRFDEVITFAPLTPAHIRQIAGLMLRNFNKRLDAEHGLTVAVTDELVDYLVKVGYNPEFGARPMARAVQDSVEYAVAQMILRGQTRAGQAIVLHPAMLEAVRTDARS